MKQDERLQLEVDRTQLVKEKAEYEQRFPFLPQGSQAGPRVREEKAHVERQEPLQHKRAQ